MKRNNKRVAIILPAYNEATVIGTVLSSLPKKILMNNEYYQIDPIVINDGSEDSTSLVAASYKHVILIEHIMNFGAGAATRTGLRYVKDSGRYEYAATMDTDGQHSPNDVQKVLKSLDTAKANIAIGSRLINTAGMPWYKVAGNKGLNVVTRLLLGVRTSDSQSGLKAFDAKAINKLTYRENGYAFCSEMLWRAHKVGLSVTETPIEAIYTEYSTSKGQSNWNGFQIIKLLIKHRMSDFIHG